MLDSNFYLESLNIGDATLNQEESRHIVKAFRAKTGDSLTLCDGKGRVAEAILTEANPQACKVTIKNISEQKEQPKIHLCVACLESNDNEEIVFHAAQMPIASIQLLRTERSLEPRNSDLSKLCRRMEAKSLAALKQSKKTWLTEIKPPIYLKDFLNNFNGNLIVCEMDTSLSTPSLLRSHPYKRGELNSQLFIITGPEGGFSPAELEMFKSKNAEFLSLGTTRLRAVTAPIFAIAKMI